MNYFQIMPNNEFIFSRIFYDELIFDVYLNFTYFYISTSTKVLQ
jgi:hypothetical protein